MDLPTFISLDKSVILVRTNIKGPILHPVQRHESSVFSSVNPMHFSFLHPMPMSFKLQIYLRSSARPWVVLKWGGVRCFLVHCYLQAVESDCAIGWQNPGLKSVAQNLLLKGHIINIIKCTYIGRCTVCRQSLLNTQGDAAAHKQAICYGPITPITSYGTKYSPSEPCAWYCCYFAIMKLVKVDCPRLKKAVPWTSDHAF